MCGFVDGLLIQRVVGALIFRMNSGWFPQGPLGLDLEGWGWTDLRRAFGLLGLIFEERWTMNACFKGRRGLILKVEDEWIFEGLSGFWAWSSKNDERWTLVSRAGGAWSWRLRINGYSKGFWAWSSKKDERWTMNGSSKCFWAWSSKKDERLLQGPSGLDLELVEVLQGPSGLDLEGGFGEFLRGLGAWAFEERGGWIFEGALGLELWFGGRSSRALGLDLEDEFGEERRELSWSFGICLRAFGVSKLQGFCVMWISVKKCMKWIPIYRIPKLAFWV